MSTGTQTSSPGKQAAKKPQAAKKIHNTGQGTSLPPATDKFAEAREKAVKYPALPATGYMQNAEYERLVYVVTVPTGIPFLEVVSNPAFWTHVAMRLKPWNILEVRAEDMTFYAECLVMDAGHNWAKVHCLRYHELPGHQPGGRIVGDYEIDYRGPVQKWCVTRRKDSEVLSQGHMMMQQAMEWLVNYEKSIKR